MNVLNHKLPIWLIWLFTFQWGIPLQAYEVTGVIHLDSSWERTLYLSAIRSFEDLNTASEDFVVNMTGIAKDGSFKLTGFNLPPESIFLVWQN